MKKNNENKRRWDDYIIRSGNDFDEFWKSILSEKERHILFILGKGFDPRMCSGIERILNAEGIGKRDCLLIEFNEGIDSPSMKYLNLVKENQLKLEILINGKGFIQHQPLKMWSDDGKRRSGSRNAGKIIKEDHLKGYTDIVLDINALPRGIYFPVLLKLLYIYDNNLGKSPNLNIHVVVAEDVVLDRKIQEEGIDEEASYLPYLSIDHELISSEGTDVIWIPVLGEGKKEHLTRIYDLIKPAEICPVLPSPARNPRRADNLILEYRELLFDKFRIEPKNILYSCERNSFETYRQIYRTIEHYQKALEVLGGCKVVISALSSKLLSIGALLAACEAKRKNLIIGVAHVESHGYKMEVTKEEKPDGELFTLWLAGECYDE